MPRKKPYTVNTLTVKIDLGDDGLEHHYCEHVYDHFYELVTENLESSTEEYLAAEYPAADSIVVDINFENRGPNVCVLVEDESDEDEKWQDQGAEDHIEIVLIYQAYNDAFAALNFFHCSECKEGETANEQ